LQRPTLQPPDAVLAVAIVVAHVVQFPVVLVAAVVNVEELDALAACSGNSDVAVAIAVAVALA